MEEFFTREAASKGVKLDLFHPDGSMSEHWLIVRGIDSDEFRAAEAKAKRATLELSQVKDDKERAEKAREVETECIASLIAKWSFSKEFTTKNVVHFLTEAPQIADQVNRFATRRSEFFSKKPTSSAGGSETK